MLSGKCPAGVGFEVGFEGHGFLPGPKRNSTFDDPGAVFGGVGHLAAIVGFEAFIQVFGKSGVMTGSVCFAGQNIDVIEMSGRTIFHFLKALYFRPASGFRLRPSGYAGTRRLD